MRWLLRSKFCAVCVALSMLTMQAPVHAQPGTSDGPPPTPAPTAPPRGGRPSGGGANALPYLILGGILAGSLLHPRRTASPTPTPVTRRQAPLPEDVIPISIVGTVSDEAGRPVAGASVELAVQSRRERARRIAQATVGEPYSEDLSYVETDRNGRYAIADLLRRGAYQLRVSAVGTAVERVAVSIESAKQVVANVVLHRPQGADPLAYASRAVFYVTERKAQTANGDVTYGAEPGRPRSLTFGSVSVSVPLAAGAPLPRGYRRDQFSDPGHHQIVQKPLPSAHAQAFFAALRAERDASASGTVLVFVHGYNQTFDQAVRAAGELRAGLEIDAPVVAYDWPSQGDIAGYAHDEDQARTSATNFIGFITELARQLPGTPIELVAHSMGNRLVTDLIEGGAGAATGTTVRLDHVVMAAPDVFTSQFTSRLRFILSSTGRIAIYASRRDQALLMSSVFHQDPRLGFFEEFPTAIRGMDTIDATDVDTSILGHGYFLDEHTVLFDMRGALADRSPPRSRMERVPIDAQFWYWKLEP